jgi:hypothetical protein
LVIELARHAGHGGLVLRIAVRRGERERREEAGILHDHLAGHAQVVGARGENALQIRGGAAKAVVDAFLHLARDGVVHDPKRDERDRDQRQHGEEEDLRTERQFHGVKPRSTVTSP